MLQGNAVYETGSHRVILREDGLLLIHSLTPKAEKAIDRATGQVLSVLPTGSLVLAAVCSRRNLATWHVLAHQSFRRWSGEQPESEVRWALTQCGFEPPDIDAMCDLCHRRPWDFCPETTL